MQFKVIRWSFPTSAFPLSFLENFNTQQHNTTSHNFLNNFDFLPIALKYHLQLSGG